MARPLDLDELVDHFTLDGDELKLLRNKSGTTRLIGGLVVAAAEGGPGKGYGIVGGFAALVTGLIATVLGWLVLARSRRTV